MSALSETIKAALTETPQQFAELIDVHRSEPWREFLTAWGELRTEDILKRDDIGRYFIPGGPADAIAAATKAE
jgi:hypothetical protein